MRKLIVLLILVVGLGAASVVVYAQTGIKAISPHSDPLVRMPGSQPGQGIDLADAQSCARCHADYNPSVEPGFNWEGSMMAQAGRDFLFWACMAVSAQDSIWVTGGNPNAVDLCERCHFPGGWLSGRSDPVNVSAMRAEDYDGVTCDLCHRMYDPFFEATYSGERDGNDWLGYWDETNSSTTPSNTAAATTHLTDAGLLGNITFFNGSPFFGIDNEPAAQGYTENASGQFFVSADEQKRASFADASNNHSILYSRYHKSKYFCGSCHDVSNPALANLNSDPTDPLPSESSSASGYFHVERTFSEFMLSAYALEGGSAGKGAFAPDVFDTSLQDDKIGRCQDCHMRDLSGQAANKISSVDRPDESIEHPKSGLPFHDLTGGNAWVTYVLASAIPGSPVFNQTNHDLLYGNTLTLTLELTQGFPLDAVALLAGVDRAKQQLESAADIQNLSYDPSTGALSFRVHNNTGHKLISGFPEGRRMFVNIKAFAGNDLIYEVNPYDTTAGTLKGIRLDVPLGANEVYNGRIVYESQPSSEDITEEGKTFHFVLATGRYKDNRIPPKGFDINTAPARLVQPVWEGQNAPDYFTAAEYAGGFDHVSINIPVGAERVEVKLYYQTTSREYIEFLRDEINGTPEKQTLDSSAYIIQTDPFLAGFRGWGDTIWSLWENNKEVPGASPFLMAEASIVPSVTTCTATTPILLSATPRDSQVDLFWTEEHLSNSDLIKYRLYYDQAGKLLFNADVELTTAYTDVNLTNGQDYCYAVTSWTESCESAPSNIICASPNGQIPGLDRIYLPFIVTQ
ncbi:MAG: hypothetical protein EHM41_06320 [Chloroflexi bacterium]|nr:MAG: hypothetical protein EHM41_06320 [Chloroflexota bacterium]